MPPTDRTITSRYELKYWLEPELVPAARACIRPFVRPDKYCGSSGNRYTISSLYLDSPGLDLYRTTTEGHRNRFKLRIRSYSDDEGMPVFCEVKKRADQVVRKSRACVDRRTALRFLRGEAQPDQDRPVAFDEFTHASMKLGAGPIVRVRYEREAYESMAGDPVRVTLDSRLMYAVTNGPDISLNGQGWVETPTEGVILELKFTDTCPRWVTSMLQQLALVRTSVPKYVLSVDHMRSRRGAPPPTTIPGLSSRH